MKNQIEIVRLKTKMSEAFEGTKLPYASQAEAAKKQLSVLQEAYKQLTGDYASEYIIQEKLSMYAEIELDDLINRLNKIKERVGGNSKIQVDGTLMNKDDGNTVILSNQKQM